MWEEKYKHIQENSKNLDYKRKNVVLQKLVPTILSKPTLRLGKLCFQVLADACHVESASDFFYRQGSHVYC